LERLSEISTSIYFSYGQFQVFDRVVKRPGCEWTEQHHRQGFARRPYNVSFTTLVEYGDARVQVSIGPYRGSSSHERVIEVPFEVASGEVVVSGPEEAVRWTTMVVPPGHYRLIAAQEAVGEEEEVISLFFEGLLQPLGHSRIVVADAGLAPVLPLLEDVDEA
jgi:hypothetical protein